ncbi:unnamed protein product [Somion occarium]|uniref:Uncharacterized protein n=1 Tax=Somion occarium TaxID=3059160 RepID=A0ABP1CSI4_9APHY
MRDLRRFSLHELHPKFVSILSQFSAPPIYLELHASPHSPQRLNLSDLQVPSLASTLVEMHVSLARVTSLQDTIFPSLKVLNPSLVSSFTILTSELMNAFPNLDVLTIRRDTSPTRSGIVLLRTQNQRSTPSLPRTMLHFTALTDLLSTNWP